MPFVQFGEISTRFQILTCLETIFLVFFLVSRIGKTEWFHSFSILTHSLPNQVFGGTQMPCNESNLMNQRLKLVARLLDGESMTAVCNAFGLSR
jgi:hypothetical protein